MTEIAGIRSSTYQLTLRRRLISLDRNSSSITPRVVLELANVRSREPVIVPTLEPVIVPALEPVIVPALEPVIVPVRDPEALVLDPVIVPA